MYSPTVCNRIPTTLRADIVTISVGIAVRSRVQQSAAPLGTKRRRSELFHDVPSSAAVTYSLSGFMEFNYAFPVGINYKTNA